VRQPAAFATVNDGRFAVAGAIMYRSGMGMGMRGMSGGMGMSGMSGYGMSGMGMSGMSGYGMGGGMGMSSYGMGGMGMQSMGMMGGGMGMMGGGMGMMGGGMGMMGMQGGGMIMGPNGEMIEDPNAVTRPLSSACASPNLPLSPSVPPGSNHPGSTASNT